MFWSWLSPGRGPTHGAGLMVPVHGVPRHRHPLGTKARELRFMYRRSLSANASPTHTTSRPPVQSELVSQLCGLHHRGPTPIAFTVHTSMKLSRCPERRLAGVSVFIREAPTFPSFDEAKFAPAIKMPRSSRPSAVWTLSFTNAHSAVTGVTCFAPRRGYPALYGVEGMPPSLPLFAWLWRRTT